MHVKTVIDISSKKLHSCTPSYDHLIISLLLTCRLRPRKTGNIFLQLVAQQLLPCKLQENIARITWPLGLNKTQVQSLSQSYLKVPVRKRW